MPKTKSSRSVKNPDGLNIYPLLKSFIDEIIKKLGFSIKEEAENEQV